MVGDFNLTTEPSVIIGGITAFVTAAIGLLVAFGLDITDEQKNAILAMTAVLAPVIASVVIRSKVYAPATVREIVGIERQSVSPMEAEIEAAKHATPDQYGINNIERKAVK